MSNLIELIDAATKEQLAELRDEIASQTKRLESLRILERILATRLEPKPPQTRAAPSPPKASPADLELRRQRIAKLIATEGPMTQPVIHERTGIPLGSLTAIMNCGAFDKNSQGYHLTVEGRRLYL